jgi:hypothetical protein
MNERGDDVSDKREISLLVTSAWTFPLVGVYVCTALPEEYTGDHDVLIATFARQQEADDYADKLSAMFVLNNGGINSL